MASPTNFGNFLRQLRKRAGMTQGDWAAAVGYSVTFICALEQNRRLPVLSVVLQQFIPALGLQEELKFATQLVELAALARGERAPTTLTLHRMQQLTITETFTFQPGAPWARLPASPTALIGREQAIKTLCNPLQGHNGRLLTLVGPPGVGKTRLGLAVASRVEALYKDGARFVPLAAVSNPELVATTIADQLELADTGQQSPQARLMQGLRQKDLLVVLDNFEQLLTAAGLLAAVLAACPGVYLLVTSRERLHLRAEQRFSVPPLELDFAVALFVQQAQAVKSAFVLTLENQPLVEKICQRLDCLPLAIELMAARSDLFSPQAMLTRLQPHALDLLGENARDAPEHQRTLRRAIQSSYALLAERERRLFRTLGVFVDGFDLAAVVHFGFDAETLQTLIHKSLVHIATLSTSSASNLHAELRFFLLETLREYAREQLVVNQEAEVMYHKHAAYYLQLVERTEPAFRGAQVAVWLGDLETEHNNLRAALTWALATGDSTTALCLCGALKWLWGWHGHIHEGKRWLEKALAIGTDAPLALRAKALSVAGLMDNVLGYYAQAQTLVEQSLALYLTMNDNQSVASISLQLGGIHRVQKHYQQAELFYQQSFDLFQALEDQWGMAAAHIVFGNLSRDRGDYEPARMHYEQGLAVQRKLDNQLWISAALQGLTLLAFQQGDYSNAGLYSEERLVLAQEVGDKAEVVAALNELGRIALLQGKFAKATRYFSQSLALAQALDYPALIMFTLTYQGDLAFAQADFAQAQQCYGQSLQIAYQLTEQLEIATGLESLASVASAQAKAESSANLIGAAANLRTRIAVPLPARDHLRYQQLMTTVRAQLSETAYASAYATGYAMTADQAVAFALAPFAKPKNESPQT